MNVERVNPPEAADERATLNGFLDYQRATVHRKIAGLNPAQLQAGLVASPLMTPGGVVSHLTQVERWWFADVLAGRDLEYPWTDADPDADFRVAAGTAAEQLLDAYAAVCEESRTIAAHMELDQMSAREHPGRHHRFSLRWVLAHLVEETARHNGHLDLLRESIDGATGE